MRVVVLLLLLHVVIVVRRVLLLLLMWRQLMGLSWVGELLLLLLLGDTVLLMHTSVGRALLRLKRARRYKA